MMGFGAVKIIDISKVHRRTSTHPTELVMISALGYNNISILEGIYKPVLITNSPAPKS